MATSLLHYFGNYMTQMCSSDTVDNILSPDANNIIRFSRIDLCKV